MDYTTIISDRLRFLVSLLYKLRVVLGLFQVASVVILTDIGMFCLGFRRLERIYRDRITGKPGFDDDVESMKVIVTFYHNSYLICAALVAIQCFRKTILAVGLHKNNPFVISASGILDIIVVSLFGWLSFLINKLYQNGEPHLPYVEKTYGFG